VLDIEGVNGAPKGTILELFSAISWRVCNSSISLEYCRPKQKSGENGYHACRKRIDFVYPVVRSQQDKGVHVYRIERFSVGCRDAGLA